LVYRGSHDEGEPVAEVEEFVSADAPGRIEGLKAKADFVNFPPGDVLGSGGWLLKKVGATGGVKIGGNGSLLVGGEELVERGGVAREARRGSHVR
jgi:hypothetical protein